MTYLIGLAAGLISLFLAMRTLGQTASLYVDHVAFFLVIGGTAAVAIITLPWQHHRAIVSSLGGLFSLRAADERRLLYECLRFIHAASSGQSFDMRVGGLPREIVRDGYELMILGLPLTDIDTILQERVYQSGERARAVANAFRTLAKYPPAFGLVGTVFGLVNLMRAISDGLDPRQAGLKMAIALIATLYGLLLANLIIAPFGESVMKRATSERHAAEIALQAVLMAAQKTSLLTAQEMLNSHLPAGRRVNVLNDSAGEDAA